jgi:hypothetical protein
MKDKGLQSIGEIMREWLNRTPGQIQADAEAEFDRERSFRRGYHQGWDAALEAIFKMWDEQMSKKDAYALAALHENALARWRATEREQFLPPPSFVKAHLLEAWKNYREKRGTDVVEKEEEI